MIGYAFGFRLSRGRFDIDSQDGQDGLFHVFGGLGAGLCAVDGRLGAPLGGEAADGFVDVLIEAKEVADHSAVK